MCLLAVMHASSGKSVNMFEQNADARLLFAVVGTSQAFIPVLGSMQAISEKTRKAGDISLETAEKAAAVAAQQLDALRAQEKEAQAQVKTLRERLASMRASKFKANELLTRSASVSSCAILLPVASLATHCSWWLTRLSIEP